MALLPNWDVADIDPSKLTAYVLNPDHSGNTDKWIAFHAVGFGVVSDLEREQTAQTIVLLLRQGLATAQAIDRGETVWGRRYVTRMRVTGPNGNEGTLVAVWQYDRIESGPRLITLWLQAHRR